MFEVCHQRGVPIFTFMNKCDRPILEPLSLLDELERVLQIGAFPVNCFAFEDGGGNDAEYCYRSAIFRLPSGGGVPTGCGQTAAAATAVAACTADSVPAIKDHLRPELLLDANGNPTNVSGAPTVIEEANPPVVGLRADQPTSVAQALGSAGIFLPTPAWVSAMMVALILTGSLFSVFFYADDIRAARLRQHGLPVPTDRDLGRPAH